MREEAIHDGQGSKEKSRYDRIQGRGKSKMKKIPSQFCVQNTQKQLAERICFTVDDSSRALIDGKRNEEEQQATRCKEKTKCTDVLAIECR